MWECMEAMGMASEGSADDYYSDSLNWYEEIEEHIVDNFVTDEARYYANATVTDSIMIVEGIVESIIGIGIMKKGFVELAAGGGSEVISLGSTSAISVPVSCKK